VEKYGEDHVTEFEEILKDLGYEKADHARDLIADYDQSKKVEANEKEAKDTFKAFGKSDNVKNILSGLKLDWDKDVKVAVTDILLEDFGISDFSNVTEKNIARAFNAFVQEQEGGIEKLLSNAKNEALKTHEEKLKLGKQVPKPGTQTTKPDSKKSVVAWARDPNTSAEDVRKKIGELAKKGR
jgi:hypothetical protein